MDLLEETLRDTNNYAKGDMKMREVEYNVNQAADSLRQQPQLEDGRQSESIYKILPRSHVFQIRLPRVLCFIYAVA